MEIEFDPAKDAINIAKHSVSLADAVLLEWDWIWAIEEARRVISLRKANRREVRLYADKI